MGGGRQRNIPGAAPPGSAPATPQQDGGSRRNKNKKSQQDGKPNGGTGASTPPAAAAAPSATNGGSGNPFAADVNTSALSAEDKKRRAVLKKLGAIEALKDRLAAGEQLEKTQVKKIDSEAELRKELAAIG